MKVKRILRQTLVQMFVWNKPWVQIIMNKKYLSRDEVIPRLVNPERDMLKFGLVNMNITYRPHSIMFFTECSFTISEKGLAAIGIYSK